MNRLLRKEYSFVAALLFVGFVPLHVSAVMQSLNGSTGQDQTFANDTNVTVSSAGAQHSFGWSGILSLLRGGTGTSTFANGGLVFSDGVKLTQNPTKLFWDNTNGFLGIGTTSPESSLHVASGYLKVGGQFPAIITGDGTSSRINALVVRANISLEGEFADIDFNDGKGNTWGHIYGSASSTFAFQQEDSLANVGSLDFTRLTADKIYVFPDYSGTFGLLEATQTWMGVNKFEASTNSTVYIGSATRSGCLVMGDSDGNGVTYVTANNGVLTATTSQPSICQ
jgi:hypothetical protein